MRAVRTGSAIRLGLKPTLAAAILACAAPTAAAQDAGATSPAGKTAPCPANSEAYAVTIKTLFQDKGAINQTAIDDANLLEAVCPDEVVTLYALADAWYELLRREDLGLQDQGSVANRAVDLVIKAGDLPQVPVNFQAVSELRQRVVDSAITMAEAGGPKPAYFEPDGKFPSCDNSWGNVSQNLWYKYKREWTVNIAPILIENMSRSCAGTPYLYVHEWFAELRRAQAERETDANKMLAMMDDAKEAYSQRAGPSRDGKWLKDKELAAFESQYELIQLRAFATRPPLPRKEWFKPKNLQNGMTRLAIALELNRIWGPHYSLASDVATKEQFGTQLRAYNTFVRDTYDEAVKASPEAHRVLYETLRDHGRGGLRTLETQTYKMSMEAPWSWTEPKGPAPAVEN